MNSLSLTVKECVTLVRLATNLFTVVAPFYVVPASQVYSDTIHQTYKLPKEKYHVYPPISARPVNINLLDVNSDECEGHYR